MDRFTVEFIDLVGQIVRAMITLHDGGFCCGHLKGESIAIVNQHNSLCAKIWNFQKCTSDGDEDLDWIRLGMLLQETRLRTTEAQDLYTSLLSGRLKGMDILDHSSLLTVRKKFDNVLLFDFYTKTHWTKEYTQAHDSTEAVSTVKGVQAPEWLDEEFNWRSHRPSWIFARCLTDPPNTYRGFSQFIRHLIQHEVDFLSPQLINEISWQDREKGEKEVDLEWHIRKAWHKAFLKLQNFVRTAKLSTTSGYISASGSKDDTIPVH
ncbi:uncharacterized protein LOC102700662 isoform X1 [Oryza brachyantha]|nr:uncharacterized protein LOC102700662 isoform X1 [Oryza brachyantha]